MKRTIITVLGILLLCVSARAADVSPLNVEWRDNYLTISGEQMPGRTMKVLYIEAYCRGGSTNQRWEKTTIGHSTRLVSAAPERHSLVLECKLKDGVLVRHEIRG